jgi:long-subunit fatty acid transport protein
MTRSAPTTGPGTARERRAPAVLLAAIVAALVAGGAEAQPQLFGNRFNFNFSNPGARSLGFGGAFAALADDATASYANPAGLVQLTRPEVSVEWRHWDRSPAFVAGGRVDGDPTGDGLDTIGGLLFGRDQSQSTSPSFMSMVVPRGRWSFAVYGHRLARFEMTSESQGFFFDIFEDQLSPTFRSPAFREQVELEVLTGGATAAWRMSDRLRFGLGVVHSDLSLTSDTSFFLPSSPGGIFQEIPLEPENLVAINETRIDGTDLTIHAGALWSANDRLSAGFFFRQGATADGTNVRAVPEEIELRGTARLAVPDVWGVGLAYRTAGGALTLAGELDRVGYEGLLRTELDGEEADGREYRDAWEYHLGAELALLRRRPILAFRVGGWVEANGDDIVEERFTHLAVGFGLAADSFQIDLAADFSEEIDTGSVSFIYSF